jgi:serine/threonine protein kinase
VKLFDFGLAKRLKDAELNENDEINLNDDSGSGNTCPTYHLTGNTGSLRYMAPEVARDECYGLSVDVYS